MRRIFNIIKEHPLVFSATLSEDLKQNLPSNEVIVLEDFAEN